MTKKQYLQVLHKQEPFKWNISKGEKPFDIVVMDQDKCVPSRANQTLVALFQRKRKKVRSSVLTQFLRFRFQNWYSDKKDCVEVLKLKYEKLRKF